MNQTELILNPDKSIYHLNLLPEEVAQTIILVGDPDRVKKVSCHFDSIQIKKHKREFITHTGLLSNHRISVISTGIGISNIEIVMNELDALFSLDLESKIEKKIKPKLNFIRIGTSGALQKFIEVDDFLISKNAIGFDGIMNFYHGYKSSQFLDIFKEKFPYPKLFPMMYDTSCSNKLLSYFLDVKHLGTTATLPGFYAPQGRELRLKSISKNLLSSLKKIGISNFEMETSAIYSFAKLMNHKAISINAILVNRTLKKFSSNPNLVEEKLILWSLERIKKILDDNNN